MPAAQVAQSEAPGSEEKKPAPQPAQPPAPAPEKLPAAQRDPPVAPRTQKKPAPQVVQLVPPGVVW